MLCYFFQAIRSVLEMIGYFATAIAAGAAFFALFFTCKALSLQRQSIQLIMYNSVVGRIGDFQKEIPERGKDTTKAYNWHIGLFNEFENMIFLTGKKQISYDQLMFYKEFMIDYIDDLKRSFPEIHKRFIKLSPQTFELLRNKYREWTNEKVPF